MQRSCFLCNGDGETLRSARWSLPHLEAHDIGFGLCARCGLAMQTESVTPNEMTRYYCESAVYTNPGRAGRPAQGKIRGVQRAIDMVEAGLGHAARSVFQVGSSDGYTLSRFREAGAETVQGVDPSSASCELARERYGVDTMLGVVEDIELPKGIEMFVLTHVLEHLYDPLDVMARIRAVQEAGDWVLVEVPLLEQVERFPPSYLTFEHLNYFDESSLVHLLTRAGFVAEAIEKSYSEDLYPIIRVLASASEREMGCGMPPEGAVTLTRERVLQHMARERCSWARVEARVRAELDPGTRVWLWGAGIHSSQMLAQTGLEEYLDLQGLVDSSPIRHGQSFGDYQIHDPQSVDLRDGCAIVISSHAAEHEIWKALADERTAGVRVVRLYADPEEPTTESRERQEVA
ncbi:MAG: hypothetical protein ACI841_004414 [Planctomycetota bacterium]|jgi:hypothetical protein